MNTIRSAALAAAAFALAAAPLAAIARDVAPKTDTTVTTTVTTDAGNRSTSTTADPDRASVEAKAKRVDQRSAEIAAKARARSGTTAAERAGQAGQADRPGR